MHEIHFYRDKDGREPVRDFMRELESRTDKASRVTLSQLVRYIAYLGEYGTMANERILKHLDGEIWELRPNRNRVLFAAWYQGSFLLLHVFMKKTQKTPPREIEQAKRELAEMKERFSYE